ncbi:hypothetical protein MPOCJGCO_2355 [Methylobacterium trifolii]|uniref:Signal recognition particle-docking protein FtsY n=2 Tax=Methylobacterium trifolii TaxID=1003092 RepID=A0ABQ4U0A1_9HYPH|nr:hypothetical protein MPOCJGCO_2355 [Methylobacterium trifolii]
MELVLILAAVVACAIAGLAVAALSARSRRPPLRMDSEFDERDEDLLLAEIGPSTSPIDRTAEVIDPEPARPARAIEPPGRPALPPGGAP